MEGLTLDIFQNLAKRAWKISWIFILYSAVSFLILLNIIIDKKLYFLDNIDKLSQNYIDIITILFDSSFLSIIFFVLMYILRGDSDLTIKKLRENFYKSAFKRVKEVFAFRFDTQNLNFENDIKKLIQYNSKFKKDNVVHEISLDNLKSVYVDGIDSLYVYYRINETKYILYSIWHSGDFIAIAVALKKDLGVSKDDFFAILEETLNLEGAKYTKNIRNDFLWFDVKYDISEDFLFNNIEKERISRKVAHIVTISIPHIMEKTGWTKF
jgi:hypothetical protein